jgi:hypothetical protein
MKFRPKKTKKGIFEERGLNKNDKGFANVLEVPMKHGDIMVMHGEAIQRVYEVWMSNNSLKEAKAN